MNRTGDYTRGKLKLGVFGNFYPSPSRLGPHTTGLVMQLAESERVESILLFTTNAARCPGLKVIPKLQFDHCWEHEDPLSLLRALMKMLRAMRRVDAYLFNVFMTSFGRSRVANALGLGLPAIVSILSRKPVVVYMHNSTHSEDFELLGYHPSRFTLCFLDLLFWLLGRTTSLVFPLPSQSRAFTNEVGVPARSLFLPYVEGLPILVALEGSMVGRMKSAQAPKQALRRILLFGSWGPQKDFESVDRLVTRLDHSQVAYQLIIAGSVNPNFPNSERKLLELARRLPANKSALELGLSDGELGILLLGTDVLCLPYRASGGSSGVMNLGAFFGVPMVATDLPQLRECASLLNTPVTFFELGDPDAFGNAVLETLATESNSPSSSRANPVMRAQSMQTSVDRLITLIVGSRNHGGVAQPSQPSEEPVS